MFSGTLYLRAWEWYPWSHLRWAMGILYYCTYKSKTINKCRHCLSHLRMVSLAPSEIGTSGGNSRVSRQFITFRYVSYSIQNVLPVLIRKPKNCTGSLTELGSDKLNIRWTSVPAPVILWTAHGLHVSIRFYCFFFSKEIKYSQELTNH
jgi:hypothetical protein